MARRERNQFGQGGGDDERRDRRGGPPRGAQPAKGPQPTNARGPQPTNARGPQPNRGPQQPPRPRSVAEDPNAYRSPGFQDVDQNPYKIDYAGLPKDVEEEEAAATESPAPQAPRRDPALPRGMLGRNADRKGTDPNAYRSPAFQDLDRLHRRYGDRRRGPSDARPHGTVRPDGAPADEPEAPEAEAAAPSPERGENS